MKSSCRKAKLSAILLLILFLSLSNCTPKVPVQTVETDTSSGPTPLPSTSIDTTLTTAAVTPTLTRPIEQRCAELLQDNPPALVGSVLLQTNKPGEVPQTYLLNLETGGHALIGNVDYETISSDGSKAAYWDLDLKSLVIVDANLRKLRVIADPEERLTPADWLDNSRLVINKRRGELNARYVVPSLIVLDTRTGEQQEWLPEYPNFNDNYNEVYWRPASRMILNPSIDYLVYPAWEAGLPVILWNTTSETEVARVYNGSRIDTPRWSPDGKQFIISAPPQIGGDGQIYRNAHDDLPHMGGNELFLVSLTGEIQRLTYLTVVVKAWQTYYSWSPDGQRIAFLLQSNDFTGRTSGELAIVDKGTGDVTDYCIKGTPFWFGDGQYVVTTQTDEHLKSQVMLIDVQTARAWQIAEGARAIGWVATP